MPGALNHTHVALVVKVRDPKLTINLRPINLCNVLYKHTIKVVANHLKYILTKVISNFQSAFVKGRLISDNILIAYEVFHHMYCQSGSNGDMAIKLDICKAFDRVE